MTSRTVLSFFRMYRNLTSHDGMVTNADTPMRGETELRERTQDKKFVAKDK